MNLNSYYFSFEPTGNEHIDSVLYAVARAGKVFHSTSQWQDDVEEMRLDLNGKTPQEWIQNSANDAAKAMMLHK